MTGEREPHTCEPDPRFRCRCDEQQGCCVRATAEDRLCDWCRDECYPGMTDGLWRPGGVVILVRTHHLELALDHATAAAGRLLAGEDKP